MSLLNIFYCDNGCLATKRIFADCTTTTETLKKIFDIEFFEKKSIDYLVLFIAYSNNKHYYLQTKKSLKSLLKNNDESFVFQVYIVKCEDSFESILDLLFCPTTRRQLGKVLKKMHKSRILVSFSESGVFSSFDVDIKNIPKKYVQEQTRDDLIEKLLKEISTKQSEMMREMGSITIKIRFLEDRQAQILTDQIKIDDLRKAVFGLSENVSIEIKRLYDSISMSFVNLNDKLHNLSTMSENVDKLIYDTHDEMETKITDMIKDIKFSTEKSIGNLNDQIEKQSDEIKALILEANPPREPSVSCHSILSEDFIEISDDDETESVYFQRNNRN